MRGTPLFATVTDNLGIFWISLDPVSVVIQAPPPLAIRLTADALLGAVQRGLKDLLTVTAAARRQGEAPQVDRDQSLSESEIAPKWI
jgi:hypothetical protein